LVAVKKKEEKVVQEFFFMPIMVHHTDLLAYYKSLKEKLNSFCVL